MPYATSAYEVIQVESELDHVMYVLPIQTGCFQSSECLSL